MKIPIGFGERRGLKKNSKELSWSDVRGKGFPWGILTFPVHASFIRLKIASVKKISKFNWIFIVTKNKNYLPPQS